MRNCFDTELPDIFQFVIIRYPTVSLLGGTGSISLVFSVYAVGVPIAIDSSEAIEGSSSSSRTPETISMRTVHQRKRALRRFSRVRRAWRATAVVIIAAFACSTYWFALRRSHSAFLHPSGASDQNSSAYSLPAANGTREAEANRRQFRRAVYAYSVIPGGIRSVGELKTAIARDPVVSAHYSTFRLERARVIQLDHDRSVHVSYRLGDRVYWTNHELRLAKGETLITDGVETARTRCGNLISENLPGPVLPKEPAESEFNGPIDITYDPGEPVSDNRFPALTPPPLVNAPPSFYEPPVAGNPWLGGGPSPEPGPVFVPPPTRIRHPSGSPPPSPPVVNAPEPGTEIQFLLALAVIVLLRKRMAQRRA
jgi:hypothetical protein